MPYRVCENAMWTIRLDENAPDFQRFTILQQEAALSFAAAIGLWERSAEFREFFIEQLRQSPFQSYRWETPPLSDATADRPFEYVLFQSPELERPAHSQAFQAQFAAEPAADVVTFANLGGDAVLVVPAPRGPDQAYPHLAAFVRSAPPEQQHRLWEAVGTAAAARLSKLSASSPGQR